MSSSFIEESCAAARHAYLNIPEPKPELRSVVALVNSEGSNLIAYLINAKDFEAFKSFVEGLPVPDPIKDWLLQLGQQDAAGLFRILVVRHQRDSFTLKGLRTALTPGALA